MSMPRRGREGGLGKPWVHQGVAKLRRGEGLQRSVAVLRHDVALFIDVFLSCFAILLFREPVYWTNEDPISA